MGQGNHFSIQKLALLLMVVTTSLHCVSSDSIELGEQSSEIVGGHSTGLDKVPWQAWLTQASSSFLCGAVILSEDLVITAAHCVNRELFYPLEVRAGCASRRACSSDENRQQVPVKEIIRFPESQFFDRDPDVALLRLDGDLDFSTNVQPIAIVTDLDAKNGLTNPGVEAMASGWGKLGEENTTFVDRLRAVTVQIVSDSQAEAAFGLHIDKFTIPAGVPDGGKGICSGDSGGPLVVRDVNNEWKLAGIVSRGRGCARPGIPDLYTRISALEAWIMGHVSGLPAPTFIHPSFLETTRCVETVTASVPFAASKVVFTFPDGQQHEDSTLPYSAEWNTLNTPDGLAHISVQAFDEDNNPSAVRQQSVLVGNVMVCESQTIAAQGLPENIISVDNGTRYEFDVVAPGQITALFASLDTSGDPFNSVDVKLLTPRDEHRLYRRRKGDRGQRLSFQDLQISSRSLNTTGTWALEVLQLPADNPSVHLNAFTLKLGTCRFPESETLPVCPEKSRWETTDGGSGAPVCHGPQILCESDGNTNGVGEYELGAPNTIDGCQERFDQGGYISRPILNSVDQMAIRSTAGGTIIPGSAAQIDVTASTRGLGENLSIYYAKELQADPIQWELVDTREVPPDYNGNRIIFQDIPLRIARDGGTHHAIRAQFGFSQVPFPCSFFFDQDDLVFQVSDPEKPPNSSPDIVVDNRDFGFFRNAGFWRESAAKDEYAGSSLISFSSDATVTFTPQLPSAGDYRVFAWWSAKTRHGSRFKRTKNAQFRIVHDRTIDTVSVSQNRRSGKWVSLGTFYFAADGSELVELTHKAGTLVADAVKFSPVTIIVDDQNTGFSTQGIWIRSGAVDHFGDLSLFSRYEEEDPVLPHADFRPKLPTSGLYEVYGWWTARRGKKQKYPRARNAQFSIIHAGKTDIVPVNQNVSYGRWTSLGTFEFTADGSEFVRLSHRAGTSPKTTLTADAIRFRLR